VRSPLAHAALGLLSPGLGLADALGGTLLTTGRPLDGFQWAAQRRREESIRLEDHKPDAQCRFDWIQEEIRLRPIEQRIDPLEQSRSTR